MYYNEQKNPSEALERFRQVKSSPGKLSSVLGLNTSGGKLYLQLYDQASGTPTGTPEFSVPVAAGEMGYYDAGGGDKGYPCDTGILIAFSTDSTTYADPGATGWFTPLFS